MSLIQMSLSGAVMILVIAAARKLLINRLPKRTFLALWGAVLVRLLLPYTAPSVYSVYSIVNRLPAAKEVPLPPILFSPVEPTISVPSPIPPISPSAPVSPAAPVHSVNWWVVVWAVGAVVCFLWFAVCYVRCRQELKTSLPVRNDFIRHWLKTHALRRKMEIRQSSGISAPLTYGVFRPVILVPKSTDWEDITALRYVLEHEYIHIRHFDAALKLIFTAALCIHWFNPAVWLMYFLANRDMELSCDEAVIRLFGRDAKSNYAMTLIHMEETKSGITPLANGFSKNAIEERIRSIMKTKKITLWVTLIAVLLVAATVILFATSPKAEKAEPALETQAVSETTVTDPVPADLLEQLTLELPVGITRKNIAPDRDALIRNGQVVGGIVVMNLDREAVEAWQENDHRLYDYLTTEIVPNVPPEAYTAGMGSSGKYAPIEMDCDMDTDGFRHSIYEGNSAYYDVWFQYSQLNTWEMQTMTASVQSPDIPFSGVQAFSKDQVTGIDFIVNGLSLPDLGELDGLWKAMQADLATEAVIPDAKNHSSWFHFDSADSSHDSSYILLGLSTDHDCFTFQIYPECRNLMDWMEKQNILPQLNASVVEKNWDFSLEPIEADANHLTLRCTRTSGHACRMPVDSCKITNLSTQEENTVFDYIEFIFDSEGTAKIQIDFTNSDVLLPAGNYSAELRMRNPDSNERLHKTVEFTVSE